MPDGRPDAHRLPIESDCSQVAIALQKSVDQQRVLSAFVGTMCLLLKQVLFFNLQLEPFFLIFIFSR